MVVIMEYVPEEALHTSLTDDSVTESHMGHMCNIKTDPEQGLICHLMSNSLTLKVRVSEQMTNF